VPSRADPGVLRDGPAELVFAPANELPYALFLPAFANVSQYHGLLKGALGRVAAAARAAAEAFVADEYLAALHAGGRLARPAHAHRWRAASPS
jgi:hypothetical protein